MFVCVPECGKTWVGLRFPWDYMDHPGGLGGVLQKKKPLVGVGSSPFSDEWRSLPGEIKSHYFGAVMRWHSKTRGADGSTRESSGEGYPEGWDPAYNKLPHECYSVMSSRLEVVPIPDDAVPVRL